MIFRLTALLCLAGLFALTAHSQDFSGNSPQDPKKRQMEFLEDHYLSSPRESHATSPAYRYFSTDFSVVQVNVDQWGMNIVDDAANEPSITFHPNSPDFIAIGWRQFDNIASNFRQAGFGYSDDAGATWYFPGNIDQGVFRSDPVLRSDREGNFFYNSLTVSGNDYFCNVYKSLDGGANWEMGTFAQGGDKQWMSIDQTQGIGADNIYANWSSSYSICEPGFFTRSTNGNLSYEDCITVPGDPYWGTTFVSDNGDLYIAGAQWSGFRVIRSTNAEDPDQEVVWDLSSSVFLDGEIVGFGSYQCPNPVGLLGQTQVSMDTSGGAYDGYMYVLCSVSRNSITDPCDVMFARSTNGGVSWEWPVRINDDVSTSNYQWFGTMSVAPDGRIDVIWLDTRDNPGEVISALYYSYSLDGGETWTDNEKLSESFNPHIGWPQQDKMGDYYDMYSTEESAHLAWAATFNSEQDVYYSVIKPHYVGLADDQKEKIASSSYPNPFKESTAIRYELKDAGFVSLKVYASNGHEISTLASEVQSAGFHRVSFEACDLDCGVYYYRLQTSAGTETGKIVKVK
jgi:hypothetical protein